MNTPPAANDPCDIRDRFRESMRRLVGGVSVITVGTGTQRTGLTVTSLSALSLEPPSVVFCVNRSASALALLLEQRSFGVNMLGARHRELAGRFAGQGGIKGEARYEGGDWIALKTGAPILSDACVALDCEVEEMLDRHSHFIVIGRALAVRLGEEDDALCYWRRDFHTLAHAA